VCAVYDKAQSDRILVRNSIWHAVVN
jgi:hypothetical protein